MKPITPEHTDEILSEMFRRVGEEYSPELTAKPGWYLVYQWPSIEAYRDWLVWLARFLLRHRYVYRFKSKGKPQAVYEAEKLDFCYGWKSPEGLKDWKCDITMKEL